MFIRFALNTLTLLWYGSIVAVLYAGWLIKDQRYLIADSGLGYFLGIVGGSMMLLLLIYPLRKKRPKWRFLGPIRFWFRFHMILGVLGPVLIIYHSNYRLGSLNSRVALISMLIVACSGLIGRYLYRRIHHGLYGEKIQFEDLYGKDEEAREAYRVLQDRDLELAQQLQTREKTLVVKQMGENRSLGFYLRQRWQLRKLRVRVLKTFERSDARKKLLDRLWSLRSICNLGINEILFSYWHVLHFPLFIMLVISGITHVVVVHFY
jgi:hypothetical protein